MGRGTTLPLWKRSLSYFSAVTARVQRQGTEHSESQETNLPLKPHSVYIKIVELFLWKNVKEMI